MGIEAQNPITHGLQANSADLGRVGARAALLDDRQGQHAAGLRGILAPAGKLAQAALTSYGEHRGLARCSFEQRSPIKSRL